MPSNFCCKLSMSMELLLKCINKDCMKLYMCRSLTILETCDLWPLLTNIVFRKLMRASLMRMNISKKSSSLLLSCYEATVGSATSSITFSSSNLASSTTTYSVFLISSCEAFFLSLSCLIFFNISSLVGGFSYCTGFSLRTTPFGPRSECSRLFNS